ncbi:hypothetical protein F442_13502 [Phytophthora nicotianae P10297]|uniref:MULE transposase domain-containing protein n=1 Tax=Phytophthora nicotianae P10297 TaxID=1317064 RepID=W2YWA1_PHYNI|nr:hypothetical protein F442_13502 [Phytophthora nicotianae P10297]
MVQDRSSGKYVPVFYVLTTHRTSPTYNSLFHFIREAANNQLEPTEFVCDFERALIDAVGDQFPNADVIGCLFHFNQAVRIKMRKIGISNSAASIAMAIGVLDMLTVLPIDQIEGPGIRWVKRQNKERCRENGVTYVRSRWDIFWRYFKRTWLELYDPVLWNVHGLTERLVARTNNLLERFNRELNAAFSTPHPSMAMFVATIEALAREHVALLDAVRVDVLTENNARLFNCL